MKQAALSLARRGLAVFPCKARDKVPATRHGCKDATTDAETIEGWWSGWPDANIGIATGRPSGVWVLDIDGADGEASLRELEKQMQPLPATVESITGGGGRHLFFRLPSFDNAPQVKNSAKQLGAGLDVRGEGGYVIAPPSVHSCGRKYAWSVDSASEFAEAPVWLIALITQPPNVTEIDPRRPNEHWARVVREGAPEGARNQTAASLAGHLLRAGIRPDITFELLLGWNATRNRPPLPEHEIERTVVSIGQRELARRRQSGEAH